MTWYIECDNNEKIIIEHPRLVYKHNNTEYVLYDDRDVEE